MVRQNPWRPWLSMMMWRVNQPWPHPRRAPWSSARYPCVRFVVRGWASVVINPRAHSLTHAVSTSSSVSMVTRPKGRVGAGAAGRAACQHGSWQSPPHIAAPCMFCGGPHPAPCCVSVCVLTVEKPQGSVLQQAWAGGRPVCSRAASGVLQSALSSAVCAVRRSLGGPWAAAGLGGLSAVFPNVSFLARWFLNVYHPVVLSLDD